MSDWKKAQEEFSGAAAAFAKLDALGKKRAWRRCRDAVNKDVELQEKMVMEAILGGMAPTILKGMGDYI